MTTTAATWFYRTPEKSPYLVCERVNSTYWEARLAGIFFRADTIGLPIVLSGFYNAGKVSLEWEPGKWLRLTADRPTPDLLGATTNILRRKPLLSYETPTGDSVWEWWLTDGDKRMQEVQGKPAYHNLTRMA